MLAAATLSTTTASHDSRRARVVYYCEGDEFGGAERNLLDLLQHLDRTRFEPEVLGVMAPRLLAAVKDLGVPVMAMNRVRSKVDLANWFRVSKQVWRSRPAVFHAMLSHSFAAQYALLAAYSCRTPAIVVTAHLPTPASNQRQAWIRKLLMRVVDVQITPSEWTGAELARLGQLARRFEVIPNGVYPVAAKSRREARTVLGLADDALVVGAAMRLVDWKRPDLVVELARCLPDVEVVLFGDGPERDRVATQAKGTRLMMTGFRDDAASLFSSLDVFVHPCPTDNQPLALLEAMANGVSVVAADEGGTAKMVEHGRTGLLAPATPEGMTSAVARLLADGNLRARLADAGKEAVRRQFSSTTTTANLEDLYTRLLEEVGW